MEKLNKVEISGTVSITASASFEDDGGLKYGTTRINDLDVNEMLAEALARDLPRDDNGRFYGQSAAKVTIIIEPVYTGLAIKVD